MKEQKNRVKWLHLRLTEAEHHRILGEFSKTTCRKLSDYARKILLGKPIIASYRNKSMDDFMTEMIKLKAELNSLGNNFNQVVKKLHVSDRNELMSSLLISYEQDKKILLDQVEKIKFFIEENGKKW